MCANITVDVVVTVLFAVGLPMGIVYRAVNLEHYLAALLHKLERNL